MAHGKQSQRDKLAECRADPECVHRQLVRLYAEDGTRHAALELLARSIYSAQKISTRLWGVTLDISPARIELNVGAVWSVEFVEHGVWLLVYEECLDEFTRQKLGPRFEKGQKEADRPGRTSKRILLRPAEFTPVDKLQRLYPTLLTAQFEVIKLAMTIGNDK